MNNKIILHLGLHKTGTTFLQHKYFPLLEKVFFAHGNSFFKPWSSQVENDNDYMMLSYEGFSGVAWNDLWIRGISNDHHWFNSFEKNVLALKKFFPNASIVVVFRKHEELLFSMYKQYIQEGGLLAYENFYGSKDAIIRHEDLLFRNRIEIIKNTFENSYFLNYHEFKKDGVEYFDSFFQSEFGINRKEFDQVRKPEQNKSISGSKVELLRRVNFYYGKLPRKVRGFIRYIRWSPRDILQQRLGFWNSIDSYTLQENKVKIKEEFASDWEFFEKSQWNYPGVKYKCVKN